MSLKKEQREIIKQYILEKINDRETGIAKKASDAYGVSLNTIYRYLREFENDNIIQKIGNRYVLTESSENITLRRSKGQLVSEDLIYKDHIDKYINELPENVNRIWQYSFMEMMNNAIDHSEAENVDIYVSSNYLNTKIMIEDDGVGIFQKIKDYYKLNSLDDAVNELFKGKLTTDAANHSGEGIFFTSRALDRFAATSSGKVFSHDKYHDYMRDLESIPSLKDQTQHCGTVIYMELSNFSNRKIREVFDMFADVDGGFSKTSIPIKNIYDTYPVSRSQAKRLVNRFESFEEIELDFQGIDDIGQGFAHELFVVFQNKHPDVKLIPVNANESVSKMINHVRK